MFAAFGAFVCGASDWFLNNYILPDLYWEGPLASLQILLWILQYALFFLAIILVGSGSIMKFPKSPDS